MMNREKLIFCSIVAALSLISFFVFYAGFNSLYSDPLRTNTELNDSLSGEKYSTGGLNNYRETNPYGSYLVGFENLTDAGVTQDDMIYINDVVTNYVMYDKKIYNGKISYVKDSFKQEDNGGDSTYSTYSFKFGINDGNITTMKVKSSLVKQEITISLLDSNNKSVFNKSFVISVNQS